MSVPVGSPEIEKVRVMHKVSLCVGLNGIGVEQHGHYFLSKIISLQECPFLKELKNVFDFGIEVTYIK